MNETITSRLGCAKLGVALFSITASSALLSLFQRQQERGRVPLGVPNQVLQALHLHQPADAALLGEAQVVVNDVLVAGPRLCTHACAQVRTTVCAARHMCVLLRTSNQEVKASRDRACAAGVCQQLPRGGLDRA